MPTPKQSKTVDLIDGLAALLGPDLAFALKNAGLEERVVRRAARLVAAGNQAIAFALLAEKAGDRINAQLRGKIEDALYGYATHAARIGVKIYDTDIGGARFSARALRRRMRAFARQRAGEYIRGITFDQLAAFRRMFSARFAAARAAAERGRGEVGKGALSHYRLVKDVVRLGWGLNPQQARHLARRMAEAEEAGDVDHRALERLRTRMTRERASTIARTESSYTVNTAQHEVWKEMGLKGVVRRWILTPDERLCPICAELDGATATGDKAFKPGGFRHPPAHPNCRCTVGLAKKGQSTARKQLTKEQRDKFKPRPKAKPKAKPPKKTGEAELKARREERRRAVAEEGSKFRKVWAGLKAEERDWIDKRNAATDAWEKEGNRLKAKYGPDSPIYRAARDKFWAEREASSNRGQEILKRATDARIAYANGVIDRLRGDYPAIDETIIYAGASKLNKHPEYHAGVELWRRLSPPGAPTDKVIVAKGKANGRAFARPYELPKTGKYKGQEVGLISLENDEEFPTVVHELMHHTEYRNPALYREAVAFRESRRRPGEEIRPLNEIDPGSSYKSSEVAIEDRFREATDGLWWSETNPLSDGGEGTAYPGKVYDHKTTEIVTMGVESMVRDADRFAKNDPEYFDWVIEHVIRRGLDD